MHTLENDTPTHTQDTQCVHHQHWQVAFHVLDCICRSSTPPACRPTFLFPNHLSHFQMVAMVAISYQLSTGAQDTAVLMSKYNRHQAFSDHLWVSAAASSKLSLKSGATVSFVCGGAFLGPFTLKSVNSDNGRNVKPGEGRLEGTGEQLAFIQRDRSLDSKCKANQDSLKLTIQKTEDTAGSTSNHS